MGLLQDFENIQPKYKESKEYEPIFLSIIKRNKPVLLTEESIQQHEHSCFQKYMGRKNFDEWLQENNLTKTKTKSGYKIHKNI